MIELPPVVDAPYLLELVGGEPACREVDADKLRGRRVIIWGPSFVLMDFCEDNGLRRSDVVHASPRSVRGYSRVPVVVLPGYQTCREVEATWSALRPVLATQGVT